MPISRTYLCGDAKIVVWAISETSEQLGAMLGDDALLCRARSFGSEKRRAEWLAVRLLLREMLGSDARLEYTAEGKPFLVGVSGYISISHTRGFAALAFSDKYPLGFDIELTGRKVGVACSYIMKECELAAVPAEWRDAYLLLRWTAAEAVYKLAGGTGYKENLGMPLSPPASAGVFALSLWQEKERGFSVAYLFDDGLLLSLCVAGSDARQISRL